MRLPTLPELPPVPALLLAMLSLQGGAAFAKTLFPEVGALGATALRVTLSAALLLLVLRPNLRALTREDWRVILPYGATLGFMNLAIYSALNYLPLGLAVTVEFSGPLVLALVLSRRALDVLWVGLAALGILLITPRGAAASAASVGAVASAGATGVSGLGVALALTAGALWASYILTGGRVARRVPGMTGVVAAMLVATVITLPVGVWHAGAALLSPRLLLLGLGVAALSSALPYALELRALRVLSAKVFGVMMSLEPALAALCGFLILHERLTPRQWLAMVCVSLASAGMHLTNRAQEQRA